MPIQAHLNAFPVGQVITAWREAVTVKDATFSVVAHYRPPVMEANLVLKRDRQMHQLAAFAL